MRHSAPIKMTGKKSSHHLPPDEVAIMLAVEPAQGLGQEEARRRLDRFGPNVITARTGTPAWLRFLHQFHAPLVYILLLASIVTALLGEWVDSSVIFAVVLINAAVGYLQESKAERAIDSLSRMVTTESTVRRDGRKQRIPSAGLVPGDVVLLEAGDRVPADLHLTKVRNLHVDESALTGESLPVAKHGRVMALDTALADRKNFAYASTLVTTGQAEGLVWATGDETETGHIARLIAGASDLSTPLTRKIAHLSRLLLWVILVLATATFAIGLARGEDVLAMFMASVALAVGAVPEGLPAAVTIVLAIGVSRMARRRAIIRKLPAVETLGATTVICSDKTGTLTENQMTVREVYAGGKLYEITGSGYNHAGQIRHDGEPVSPTTHPALQDCLLAGVLCNDALLHEGEDGRIHVQGDPTEAALLVAAGKAGLEHSSTHARAPRLDAIPFESENMFRATLHDHRDGKRVIYKVGAVEVLLNRCTDMLDATGHPSPLDKAAVLHAVEAMASRGLRVLAMARRSTDESHTVLEHHHVSSGLTFLGLQGMIDPPRPEAVDAILRCRQAGIAVKMITGDHLVTARAIACQIGLFQDADNAAASAISGQELEKLSDADLSNVAERTAVFARVAPEQKLRLVSSLQARGHVVAMTGDGVNDAPALKQADIGVAMGITGTDVAKGAADMILTDDNFATIEAAVEEGRGVFDNLTKFMVWTLPTNMGEAVILMTAILLGTQLPALPVQLLWINMTTAIFLGLMLVFEDKEADLMMRPPRDPQRPLLTHALIMRTGLVCLIMLMGSFWLFFHELHRPGGTLAEARTAVINVIVLVEIGYLFNCRSLNHSLWALGIATNRWVLAGATAMLGLQMLFTYGPVMNQLFHTAPLRPGAWLSVAVVALASFAAVEFEKWVRFGRRLAPGVVPE